MFEIAKFIENLMNEWGLPYTFDGWDEDLELPHWIGEIRENPSLDEDGKSEYSFILTGFDALLSNLFAVSEQFKEKFKQSYIVNGMAIMYENTLIVPTQTDCAKQIQINLNIKKWSV